MSRLIILMFYLVAFLPASAAATAEQLAAFTSFDRAIRSRLDDARVRNDALQKAAANGKVEEMTKAEAIDHEANRASAAAVRALPVPPELAFWTTTLQTARQHAVGALEARADGNARLARTRENAYAAIADGLFNTLRKR